MFTLGNIIDNPDQVVRLAPIFFKRKGDFTGVEDAVITGEIGNKLFGFLDLASFKQLIVPFPEEIGLFFGDIVIVAVANHFIFSKVHDAFDKGGVGDNPTMLPVLDEDWIRNLVNNGFHEGLALVGAGIKTLRLLNKERILDSGCDLVGHNLEGVNILITEGVGFDTLYIQGADDNPL